MKKTLGIFLFLLSYSFPEKVLVNTIDFQGAGGNPGLRLGDIDGDGIVELVVGQPIPQPDAHTPQEVARITAFELTGEIIWQFTRPGNPNLSNHSASSDIPLQVYDWDGDGKSEIIAAFEKDSLSFLNGETGKIMRKIPIPQGTSNTGASGSNDCIIIANLRGTEWPQDFILKTRYTQVWGVNGENGDVLWTQKANGDNLAHYGYAFNADSDAKDEYISGWQLLDDDGSILWNARGLTMHLDAITVGDIDNNPENGIEMALASQVGAVFNTYGTELWRDNHTTSEGQGIQHIAMGDFHPDHPGKEIVMLERIGPRTDQGRDANILTSSTGELIWKEERTGNDYGWLTVTERISNWEGNNEDHILSYRRTSKPPTIYDGDGNAIETFEHPGSYVDFLIHGNICGDKREEVIVFSEEEAWIFSNGGCDLTQPPEGEGIPQNRRWYNWTIYSGWEAEDYTFFTPGTTLRNKPPKFKPEINVYGKNNGFEIQANMAIHKIVVRDLEGKIVQEKKFTKSKLTNIDGLSSGLYLIQIYGAQHTLNKWVVSQL